MSKMYRVRYLKASPWVGARSVLGKAPTVSRACAPQALEGGFSVFAAGSVRLDRSPLYPRLTQPRLEWGSPPTRHPSYSLPCPASSRRRLGKDNVRLDRSST